MAFQYITFASAVSALASRLGDLSQVYWNQPNELLNCINESLRLFQALTGSFKQKMVFSTSQYQNYYPLGSQTSSPVASTVTDVEVINNVLAALLEPPITFPAWTGTGQFTLTQLTQSMQNRLNRYFGEAGRNIGQVTINGPTPTGDLVALPEGTQDVRRAAWLLAPAMPASVPPQPGYPLGRMDEWSEQAYIPAAPQNPGQPTDYSVFGVPPQQIRTIPAPSVAGQLDLLLNQSGPTVNLNPGSPVVLNISNDLSPGLKWGVLADLLGTDGPSRDYARAAYCEQRWQEFIQVSRLYPLVLTGFIGGVTCGVGSVFDMDFYQPDWQQQVGAPAFVGMCGRHMACIGQTPDDGTAGGNPGGNYSVALWVCANAPVAAADIGYNGYLQLSEDQVDPVIDYAQHIASFKMAGAEFDGTTRLYENFIRCAKEQNGRLDAVAFYKEQLHQPAQKSELEVARMYS